MGILNVTPDSFSDGGSYIHANNAIEAAVRMTEEGADLIDVGGESTRPGAEPVTATEELKRVIPVVAALAREGIHVSVDTMKASVARAALEVGAAVINDITALGDPEMAKVCADAGCIVCLMHMQGEPRTMQRQPHYEDVEREVTDFLRARADYALSEGVAKEKIWIDPGIGFGKNDAHNLTLLRAIPRLAELGYPVLVGVSRKGFIGRLLGGLPVNERLEGTLAIQAFAQLQGARIVRAHDVKATRRVVDTIAALTPS